jgi:hypothetical protein
VAGLSASKEGIDPAKEENADNDEEQSEHALILSRIRSDANGI